MRSGRLRDRLILQSKADNSPARDEYGSASKGWATEAIVWGLIEPLSVRERFSQQQVQAEAKVQITLRFYDGLNTTWRVKHFDAAVSPQTAKYYDIVTVINKDERDIMQTLLCRQGISEDT